MRERGRSCLGLKEEEIIEYPDTATNTGQSLGTIPNLRLTNEERQRYWALAVSDLIRMDPHKKLISWIRIQGL